MAPVLADTRMLEHTWVHAHPQTVTTSPRDGPRNVGLRSINEALLHPSSAKLAGLGYTSERSLTLPIDRKAPKPTPITVVVWGHLKVPGNTMSR